MKIDGIKGKPPPTFRSSKLFSMPYDVDWYDSHTDAMGIDFGSTRIVCAVSRNHEIDFVKVDNTEEFMPNAISFEEKKPVFGSVALRHLKSNSPEAVIVDLKSALLDKNARKNHWLYSTCSFEKSVSYLLSTQEGYKSVSLKECLKLFVKKFADDATIHQSHFNGNKRVNKAVFTVPSMSKKAENKRFIMNIVEAAESAKIEILDIIEETQADLLYYLSEVDEKDLRHKKRILMIDLGDGTGIAREYTLFTSGLKKTKEVEDLLNGRTIDNLLFDYIMNKLKSMTFN
uniref:Uncharacterized protein n=1 Tax=Panagrolaimus sp. JU765 TaxID=591449 RepID=A0AC34R552_9BILA